MSLLYLFSYWFWPNPGNSSYSHPRIVIALVVGVLLIVGSFLISAWRKRTGNPMTRTLSASWASTSFAFGLIAIVLAVSRVEMIQFLSMRILWVIWLLGLVGYVVFQTWRFNRRHYVIVKHERVADERDKYLPRKKK